jgi:hypothetical protein
MGDNLSRRARVGLWCGVTVFLLAWNGVLAAFANPHLLLQQHDGTQYHLLVRNRLHGHYEVSDTAHTVRAEGQNPIWRPGLVWIEEGLARCLGSVQASAAVASVLGATLMELALLGLAAVCFGSQAVLVLCIALVLPMPGSGYFMRMAVGQGPEPWAAAAVLAGLLGLAMALRRQSWRWALAGGVVAGLAEWFRAGSYLIFLCACLVYGLAALCRRERKLLRLPGVALASFVAVVWLSGLLVPSPVNKTLVALFHRLREADGIQVLYAPITKDAASTVYLGNLQLAPNGKETYCDYAVHRAHGLDTWTFLAEHGGQVAAIYLDGLQQAVATGFQGLRELTGGLGFSLFACGLVISLARRRGPDFHALALTAGAVAHYAGPVILLRGPDLTHYLMVILPLLLAVAAYGAVNVIAALRGGLRLLVPRLAEHDRPVRWPLAAMSLAPIVCLAAQFYSGALGSVLETYRESLEDREAIAGLGLTNQKVACRSMAWFLDSDIQTVLLPYGTAAELAYYAQVNDVDGLLLWESQDLRFLYFYANPYPSLSEFHQAIEQSGVFGAPRISGTWRWYPLRNHVVAQGGA